MLIRGCTTRCAASRRRRNQSNQSRNSGQARRCKRKARGRTMSAICGIVGEGAAAGKGRRDVSLMLELLAPRGPDGATIHESADPPRPYAFGVRQLAVGGLPATPVVSRGADARTVAVFDG